VILNLFFLKTLWLKKVNKIIIGCDPDSDKSGFAILRSGKLSYLGCIGLHPQLSNMLTQLTGEVEPNEIELHIENVNGIRCSSFNWIKPRNNSPAEIARVKNVNAKISENVGKCKNAQYQIERIVEHFGIKVVHHPVSKMWKDSKTGKAALEKVFGYTGQSNEDSRSAAYFAHRALSLQKVK